MKSLDILNRVIQSYQKCFIIGSLEEADKLSCLEMVKIKADLEVLEIIKKKKVDFVHLNNYLFLYDKNEEVLEKYNKYCFYQNELTMEELLKLKQWLEVNENEKEEN